MSNKNKKFIKSAFHYLVIIALCAIFLMPFILMFSTSFKTRSEALASGGFRLIPLNPTFENYPKVFERIPYFRYMGNTLFITLMCLLGQMISSPMVAYSISKIKWRGSSIIFSLILATMMIPFTVTMIPIYKVWSQLHLTGGYAPLIIPAFFGTPFYIIILRQFFMNLPDSLIEAAKIDGASQFTIYTRIMLPLCKPALATVAIYVVLAAWSDYLAPLIYISKESSYTLSLGLQAFVNQNNVEWSMLMAAATLFVLPVLVMFIIFQRYLVDGISTTGLK